MKLFLDDLRTPPDNTWVIARTANEAILYLKTHKVTDVTFDHDLGEDTTGYDVVTWFESYLHDHPDCPVPFMKCHSANPAGRANIERAIDSINNWAFYKR